MYNDTEQHAEAAPESIVDELAQFIRQVDGNHKMGAGSLADKICERFRVDAPAVQGEPVAWYLPSEDGYDSCFRDHATIQACTANPWTGWVPLYLHPQPAEQQPAPDVSALVEALERVMYCNEVKFLPEGVQQAVSDALATHRKQGGGQ